jgi:hypothetical protein
MRFNKYLTEKKYKSSPEEIKKAAKLIAKRDTVKEKHLKFIGAENTEGFGTLFYFNIMDPKHEKFKSTVAEKI